MFLLLLLATVTQLVFSQDCPPGACCKIPASDNCVTVETSISSYFTAEQKCKAKGGDLQSVPNSYTNAYLSAYAHQINLSGKVFIGADNQNSDHTWQWRDGTPMKYNRWGAGEPGSKNGCATIDLATTSWHVVDCTTELPYYCELPKQSLTV